MEAVPARLAVPVNDTDHVRGPANAPVTLVEYGDFECPYCGMAYPVVKALEKRFAHEVRFVFRNFPLPQHPHALAAAETSEFAADGGRFWEMHDMLFEHQHMLDVPHLLTYAERLELDPAALARALREGTYRPLIVASIEGGEASGVEGTPTFFLNGVRFDAEPTLDTLGGAIGWLLEQRR